MYAIIFDINTDFYLSLNDSISEAYADIRKFMESNDFTWQQEGVYFGTDKIDAVKCVLVIQDLSRVCPWFPMYVNRIRMLRIEENSDLQPAIPFHLEIGEKSFY